MLFDGPPSELPIATLRPSVHGRRGLGLQRRLSHVGAWLRPRRIPLLVAFASLFGMLGVLETITTPPAGERLRVAAHGPELRTMDGDARPPCAQATREPVRFLLRPLAPGDHTTVITLVTLDP